jgi:hypothetical protein
MLASGGAPTGMVQRHQGPWFVDGRHGSNRGWVVSHVRSARAAVVTAIVLLTMMSTAVSGAGQATSHHQGAPAAATGAEIRVTMGRILAENAFLLMELMRAEAAEAPERDAIRAALDDNTVELRDAVGTVYDEATGDSFVTRWQAHIDLLVEYAQADAAGDAAKLTATGLALDEAQSSLGAFLVEVNPRLHADEIAAALRLETEQMRRFADNPAAAYAAGREAFVEQFTFSDLLAKAIIEQFPKRYADERVVFSPAADLRVALDRLLGEHLLIAGEAMRTGLVDSVASEPARATLEENTKDLSGAMGSVYGPDADAAFGDLWRRHIDAYLDYIDGVQTNDAAEKERTLGILRSYGPQFGAFIASANNQLPADAVANLIHHHVEALISQVNAFAAEDYPRAFSTVREAYGHMFTVGDALAGAIAAQFPDRFPDLAALPITSTADIPLRDGSQRFVFLGLFLIALGCLMNLWTRRPRWS